MKAVLLDTHVWAWTFTDSPNLSTVAREAIAGADAVLVSPVSFFEIAQKVRVGKWPEMRSRVGTLTEILGAQNAESAPLTAEICEFAGIVDWAHRDPFDRLLAATAHLSGVPLVSADPVFETGPSLQRVW